MATSKCIRKFTVNRADWSGREVTVSVFKDNVFELDGSRYVLVEQDHEPDFKKEFGTSYLVIREGERRPPSERAICSVFDIALKCRGETEYWCASAYNGDYTRENKDPMVAAVQLLCNII